MKLIIYVVFFSLLLFGCAPSYEEPQITLEKYHLEEGFDLKVVASEPHLVAPVQMDFDGKGRIWVTDMPGFMKNIDGTGEYRPTGAIKILEDRDDDGVIDHTKIFLDSLVLPRAISLVYGGLLYAEPPNLWFVEIDKNDQPVNRVLVDSLYALEGNPEYQPNGLELNIDNWLYNAGSHFRYQRKNGVWKKEPTTFRGQWGITHDNFGRLYYNNNSTQLLGDFILPNRLVRNEFLVPNKGVNQVLTRDQRVYPLHAALVNRGYVDGVLDKDSLLIDVTAACGPLVYRGGRFPEEYDQNVFVCIPEANLIKRNTLNFDGNTVSAQQAWQGKEFLASTDEGFRPVSLSNGPDGSMYIVDMHRGVIQHHAFLSPYLKKMAKEKKLDTLVDFGRILRISRSGENSPSLPNLDELSAQELVKKLQDKNGWIRDQAQHRLVYKNKTEVVPELVTLAQDTENSIAQIHALNALNGLDEGLNFKILADIALASNSDVVAHAIILLEKYIKNENLSEASTLFQQLLDRNDKGIDLYLASTLGSWANISKEPFYSMIKTLKERYDGNLVLQEAILSGIGETNSNLLNGLKEAENDSTLQVVVQKNIDRIKNENKNPIFVNKGASQDSRTKGAKLFRQICAACHQANGSGIEGLAPPLTNSEHILPPNKLALIVLHGLKGPIEVNGVHYDINHAMPGLVGNEALKDADISAIISYVTNAFSSYPRGLSTKKIKELREIKAKDSTEYTIEELNEVVKSLK